MFNTEIGGKSYIDIATKIDSRNSNALLLQVSMKLRSKGRYLSILHTKKSILPKVPGKRVSSPKSPDLPRMVQALASIRRVLGYKIMNR
jgi:hypothetical protein